MATTKTDNEAKNGGKRITIRLTAGLVGKMETQRKVVRALGLRRFNSTVEHVDSPTIRGMVNKVRHLVTVDGEAPIQQQKHESKQSKGGQPKEKVAGKAKAEAKG